MYEDRIRVNCAQCAGDCVGICVITGLPVKGGLLATREQIEQARARIPFLEVQRFQREQLHALIDKAEKCGAYLYSRDERPYRPHVTFDRPEPSPLDKVLDKFVDFRSRYRSPQQVRALLTSDYHPEDFYNFRWTLIEPESVLKKMQSVALQITAVVVAFKEEIDGLPK